MDERTRKWKSPKIEVLASMFFVYTTETKDEDIAKKTLTHLQVDSSVSEIPAVAFRFFKALVHVKLPETLTRIGKEAFHYCCSLKFVQFVSNNDSRETLSNPTDLEEGTIVFPASVKLQIDQYAFQQCHSLRKVIFYSATTQLGQGIFYHCHNLISVELPERLQVIKPYSFVYCDSLTTVKIPSSMIKIGEGAFHYCRSLKYFELPHGLLEIGNWSFHSCRSMETIHIPSTVSTMGELVFDDCTRLTHITLPPTLERIENGTFKGCRRLPAVDLPHGLLKIGKFSFRDCHSVETLRIPATVSSIEECAFGYCRRLRLISLPPTLARIENEVFAGCVRLEYMEIPTTVSFIGERAFYKCDSLSHIRIPPSVESITPVAFLGCSRLISVELPERILIDSADLEVAFDEDTDDGERLNVLVNLAMPTLPEDDEVVSGLLCNKSKLGSVVDGSRARLHHKMKHRFDHSPLNKLCYYHSYHSSADAMVQLRCLMEDDPLAATMQTDEFGMTPLHALSLSQTPNMEMLLALMKEGKADHVVRNRDSFGSTPMDYLCLNHMPNSAEVIRSVLFTRFDYLLGLNRSWKPDMLQSINEALAVDLSFRRREIVATYLKLANYERKVIFSLLELRLWKNGGGSAVTHNVLLFLDTLDVEDYFAQSP